MQSINLTQEFTVHTSAERTRATRQGAYHSSTSRDSRREQRDRDLRKQQARQNKREH